MYTSNDLEPGRGVQPLVRQCIARVLHEVQSTVSRTPARYSSQYHLTRWPHEMARDWYDLPSQCSMLRDSVVMHTVHLPPSSVSNAA